MEAAVHPQTKRRENYVSQSSVKKITVIGESVFPSGERTKN
jgi:hypothetical protein